MDIQLYKKNTPYSPSELLSQIIWETVEVETNAIWFKTRPISAEQYNTLRIILRKIEPYFIIPIHNGEVGFWDGSVFSFTILRDSKHPYWDTAKETSMGFYANKPIHLFCFHRR